ncbi:hypothetical protein [Brasilonema octagenarum]|uniref:hypothetical protein n=1 Tax=Brasilonema octagenarum TaxID=417105 RepID=UPI00145E3B50|nr:hypothetical protein [Brasilonema octagenarum]
MRTSRLRRMPDTSVGKPLRVRQMPAEGDPPAALVSPPAALSHRLRRLQVGKPAVSTWLMNPGA